MAEAFGTDAERYDRTRPRYPDAMAWDPTGRTFDTVIAGTAWHWVDPIAGAAKAAQVLRPGGRLAAFWHVSEPPPAVAEAFAAVCRRVMPDSPFNAQPTRSALDGYARNPAAA
jgi:SAM-dependent methyltransferase